MKNKILFAFLSLALVLGAFGFVGAQTVHAQAVPSFPIGCTSNLAYSVKTGMPCNGTGVATMGVQGCSTALGYSTTNGAACDGNTVAIPYLYGCTSIYDYSIVSGAACNGTNVALPSSLTITTPGFPVTGAGADALVNLVLLLSLGIVAIGGGLYLARKI